MIHSRTISKPMQEHSPCERMLTLRECAAVKRYHTERVAGDTVASHSYGVALLILEIFPSAELRTMCCLLKAALLHDIPERQIGDVPYFSKRLDGGFRDYVHTLEEAAVDDLDVYVCLTERERVLLKTADLLEMCFFAYEQRRLGNKNADFVFENLKCGVEAMRPLAPRAEEIWEELKIKYQEEL